MVDCLNIAGELKCDIRHPCPKNSSVHSLLSASFHTPWIGYLLLPTNVSPNVIAQNNNNSSFCGSGTPVWLTTWLLAGFCSLQAVARGLPQPLATRPLRRASHSTAAASSGRAVQGAGDSANKRGCQQDARVHLSQPSHGSDTPHSDLVLFIRSRSLGPCHPPGKRLHRAWSTGGQVRSCHPVLTPPPQLGSFHGLCLQLRLPSCRMNPHLWTSFCLCLPSFPIPSLQCFIHFLNSNLVISSSHFNSRG